MKGLVHKETAVPHQWGGENKLARVKLKLYKDDKADAMSINPWSEQ